MHTNKFTYFDYTRKSLRDEDRQAISLESQAYDLNVLAKREALKIKDHFSESRTAKLPGRPEFNSMLDRIERGEANGILVWDIDRLYRNPVDEGRVRWLLQQGIIASILTPTRQYFPQDAGLLMAVEGGRAIEHNLRFAKALRRTHEAKLRNGQWPGTRILGYIFDERTKNIAPDPETAPTITQLFEEYSKGNLGLEAGARWLAAQGISSGRGTPFAKSKIVRILRNKIYMGLMPWKGELHLGQYKPLVTAEVFKRVQAVMKIKGKPRKRRNGHSFPFCGLFHCSCGSMITAQWAKGHGGTYRYYRCTKKNGPCAEPYLQEQHLTEKCLERLQPLCISIEEAREIREEIRKDEEQDSATLGKSSKQVGEALTKLDEKLRKLTRHLLDEIIDEDMYRASKEEILIEKTALTQEKNRLKKKQCNYGIEPALTVISTLETLGTMPAPHSPQETANILRKIGTNLLLSKKTATFSFSEDYDFLPSLLASARIADQEVAAMRRGDFPQHSQSSKWCARRESNPRPSA